jgi:small conductance mechanosensitive channel
MQQVIDKLAVFAAEYGLKLIGAVVILIAGKIVAGLARKLIAKLLNRAKTDPTIVSFAGNLVYFMILVFTVVAALGNLGVQMTSFIAIIGAAGLAVGGGPHPRVPHKTPRRNQNKLSPQKEGGG